VFPLVRGKYFVSPDKGRQEGLEREKACLPAGRGEVN